MRARDNLHHRLKNKSPYKNNKRKFNNPSKENKEKAKIGDSTTDSKRLCLLILEE